MHQFTVNNLFIRSVDEVTRPELAEPVAWVADMLELIRDSYSSAVARIETDGNLSPDGKERERATLKDQVREAISKATDEPKANLERRFRQSSGILTPEFRNRLRGRLPENSWERGPALAERNAQEREIRAAVRGMDETEAKIAYLDAARRADPDTVAAFENAPVIARLVDDETQAEAAELFAQAAFPDEWELYVQEKAALDAVTYNVAAALRDLEPPVPAADLVA